MVNSSVAALPHFYPAPDVEKQTLATPAFLAYTICCKFSKLLHQVIFLAAPSPVGSAGLRDDAMNSLLYFCVRTVTRD
jgi:hypothetical protein